MSHQIVHPKWGSNRAIQISAMEFKGGYETKKKRTRAFGAIKAGAGRRTVTSAPNGGRRRMMTLSLDASSGTAAVF